jgi:hypothetical protein
MEQEVSRTIDRVGASGVFDTSSIATLAEMSLEEASITNHGPTFHAKFIAPLCDKVVAGGAASVLATWRRKAWAPLFHPATLLSALRGKRPDFQPRRTFHTVEPDGCGAVVDELLARIDRDPRITVETVGSLLGLEPVTSGAVRMTFSDGASRQSDRPVIGVSAEELFASAAIAYRPDKVRTAIAWLEASRTAMQDLPQVVHVLDPSNAVLRVSESGGGAPHGRAVVCVEMRHDSDADQLGAESRAGLVAAGLLDARQPVKTVATAARPTFAVPSLETHRAFRAAQGSFASLGLDVDLVGGALDVGADSLNEQIIQGLRIGDMST